jgi:enolase-phosphatase E1
MEIDAVVLDVEGTTTPVDFVYGTLFPYAKQHLPQYLRDNSQSVEVRSLLELLVKERLTEPSGEAPPYSDDTDPTPYLLWLMDADRKSPALKSLQGKVWEAGYREGTLKGAVFSDVPAALLRWHSRGVSVCIYSSGSVLAQKLLFTNSAAGDLSECLVAHFDTEVGAKGECQSYATIASRLKILPERILFVSDIVSELRAASEAGYQCLLSDRPGNKQQPAHNFRAVASFDDVELERAV